MKAYLVLACVFALLMGCTDAPKSVRVLEESGYKNVNVTGYRWFGCGEHDSFHTGFTAVGFTGKPISGVVCSGWFKNSTIRLD